jgi:hypothetical protein
VSLLSTVTSRGSLVPLERVIGARSKHLDSHAVDIEALPVKPRWVVTQAAHECDENRTDMSETRQPERWSMFRSD